MIRLDIREIDQKMIKNVEILDLDVLTILLVLVFNPVTTRGAPPPGNMFLEN